jgi:hypothetical protein
MRILSLARIAAYLDDQDYSSCCFYIFLGSVFDVGWCTGLSRFARRRISKWRGNA